MNKNVNYDETKRRLRKKINEAGVSAKKISETLNVTNQAVYKWLNQEQKTIPTLYNMTKLSQLLGCNVEDIYVLYDEELEHKRFSEK